MAAPPPPPPPPNLEELKRRSSENLALHNNQTDGLSRLASEFGTLLMEMGVSQQHWKDTYTRFMTEIAQELQNTTHLTKDISAMANASTAAQEALAQAQKNIEESKKRFAELDEKHKRMTEDAKQLQAQANAAEEAKRQALLKQQELETQNRTLTTTNQELHTLHESQIVQITTNIQTLATLKQELERLKENVSRFKTETDSTTGIMKLYFTYPYLIKLRHKAIQQWNDKEYPQQWDNSPFTFSIIQNSLSFIRNGSSIPNLPVRIGISQELDQIEQDIRKIIDGIKTVKKDNQDSETFWSGYKEKITKTKRLLADDRWAIFIIAHWLQDWGKQLDQNDPELVRLFQEKKTQIQNKQFPQ